jgi:hypothetical protein
LGISCNSGCNRSLFVEGRRIPIVIMSNSSNQTSIPLSTAEIAEIKKSFRTTPLQWSSLTPTLILTSHFAGVL